MATATPIEETTLGSSKKKLNWLRAAVLGANDGIVSTAALVVGVAGAANSLGIILTAGTAGLISGALSMALGEYVSVSTQRDTEHALVAKEKQELEEQPAQELAELAKLYLRKGLSLPTALKVAQELTAHDPVAAHMEAELHIDPKSLTNPWHAAWASAITFSVGGLIPLVAIATTPESVRITATFVAVFVALIITGSLSAHAGGSNKTRATMRIILGGTLAMIITFGVGKLFGTIGI